MKKAITIIAALLVLVCIAGCGNAATATTTSAANTEVSKMSSNSASNVEVENLHMDKVKYTVTEIEDGKLTVKDESDNISVLDIDENVEYKFYRPDMGMPEGNEGGGNPPQMPNGEMPDKPNGEGDGNNPPQMPNGEMPDKPSGSGDGNNPPQMQGNPPEKPEGENIPKMPDGMESPEFESISVGDVIYVITDDSGKVSVIEIEMTSFDKPQNNEQKS